MTLNELQLDIYRRLNLSDSPPTAVANRILTFINQRHRQILSRPGLQRLRDDNLTFASVASQANYALGPVVARIKTIYDGTTNQLKLAERTLQWLRTTDPRNTASGTPEAWIPLSIKQVQVQPASATALYIKSTAAGDTTQTVRIETVRTGGYRRQDSAVLSGTAAVQVGTLSDHIEVDKVYLSATAVGTVTLETAAAAGTVLASIAIGQTYQRYRVLQLWPIPSAVVTYNVDYTREVFDMSQAADEPLLPPDFHYLLSVGARLDEYEHLDDNRRVGLQPEWELGIKRLQHAVINSDDFLVVPGGSPHEEGSNLGSWYPEGRW